MKSFIVSWFVSGYTVTYNYLVVSDSIESAKILWNEFIAGNEELRYSWEKARKGDINHTGGYTSWRENGEVDRECGCYELKHRWRDFSSDHLSD